MDIDYQHIEVSLPFEATFALAPITNKALEAEDELSNDEKKEFESCTKLKRRQEFISSRILLKRLAAEQGIEDNFEIIKDELGQPFGHTSSSTYNVSIAHTKEDVFCGLSLSTPIGVDIEPADRSVHARLEQRIRHPQEKITEDIPLIRLWTIKEAYIKLRGQGLRLNMNEVHIERESEQIFMELNNDKRAKICSFRLENKWLAIAYYQN